MKNLVMILAIAFCVSLQANVFDNLKPEHGDPVILKNDKTGKTKKISLIKINLTKKHEQELNERINSLSIYNRDFRPSALQNYDLGMENVPVLDQGQLPTCITFAVSALVNAHKKAGDFISQQCMLQFSESIANYDCPAGWDGSWGRCVLNQIRNYGVVSKEDCPTEYPDRYAGRLDYNKHLQLSNNGQWSNSYNITKLDYANDVDSIKSLLTKQKRVLVAFLITKSNNGGDPIDGYESGLWRLPDNTSNARQICGYNMQNCAGHGVIITGYDDNRQIFKVRNSWGPDYGADGDYYMSYDYLRVMVQRGYFLS